jgi:phosphoenolpyruvate carboxykinase (ATP)
VFFLFYLFFHCLVGIDYNRPILRNASVAVLYEEALKYEEGTAITSAGALCTMSGAKTGRSPRDKRIVDESSCSSDVWWGTLSSLFFVISYV